MPKIEVRIGLSQNDKGAYFVTFGEDGLDPQQATMLGGHIKRLGEMAELLNMLLSERVPLGVVKKIESHI